jgi:hypothetical protein
VEAIVINKATGAKEVLDDICVGFKVSLLLRDLAQYLVDQRLAGRMVLLVIDEAQNLSQAALEELRMLSNLETEKSKLLQVVLIGQPDLRDTLAAPALEQLRQRITVSYHLTPLDADETERYINHRLRRAALGTPVEFPRRATDAIHARSRGVPRIVNVICDAALVFGYAEERRTMDPELVADVLDELELTGVLPPIGSVNVPESAPASAPGRTAQLSAREYREHRLEESMRQDLGRRSAELDEREQAVRQRERELAEQRRILAEEYRLLRTRTAGAPHGYTPPQSVRVQVQAPLRAEGERAGSLWHRIKRTMLGASSPAME